MSPEALRHIATPPAVWAAHLQVAVDALGSTLVHSQITLGETVEEVAIFISCAVLLKDFPHFRLKKGHVYVNSYHLKSKTARTAVKSERGPCRRADPLMASFPVLMPVGHRVHHRAVTTESTCQEETLRS